MTDKEKEELKRGYLSLHIEKGAEVSNKEIFDWFISVIEEREKLLREKLEAAEKLYDGLEDAITGLTWTMEAHPENVDKADYEKIEEWKTALEHYKALKV